MSSNADDNIDEIATDLDDIKTSVEELQVEPHAGVDPASIERLKNALERASDATAELEDQKEES